MSLNFNVAEECCKTACKNDLKLFKGRIAAVAQKI